MSVFQWRNIYTYMEKQIDYRNLFKYFELPRFALLTSIIMLHTNSMQKSKDIFTHDFFSSKTLSDEIMYVLLIYSIYQQMSLKLRP